MKECFLNDEAVTAEEKLIDQCVKEYNMSEEERSLLIEEGQKASFTAQDMLDDLYFSLKGEVSETQDIVAEGEQIPAQQSATATPAEEKQSLFLAAEAAVATDAEQSDYLEHTDSSTEVEQPATQTEKQQTYTFFGDDLDWETLAAEDTQVTASADAGNADFAQNRTALDTGERTAEQATSSPSLSSAAFTKDAADTDALFWVQDRETGKGAYAEPVSEGFRVSGAGLKQTYSKEAFERRFIDPRKAVDTDQPIQLDTPQEQERVQERRQPQGNMQGQVQQATVPFSQGLLTRATQALFGGMGSLLAGSALPSEGSLKTQAPATLSLEARLQASREKRAIEHMLSLEDRLDACRGQFDSIRTNPVFSAALKKVQTGEMDRKDFFLDLARSPRSGPQDTMQLDAAINDFHHSIAELGALTRQVERSCEKAGIDSTDIMENVGTFFDELDGPEGDLMPNANDGNTIAEKIKEFIEKFMAFFRRAPEEDSSPSPA